MFLFFSADTSSPAPYPSVQANAESLGSELPHVAGGSGTVLYPTSLKASKRLQDTLTARGFAVRRMDTYDTVSVSSVEPGLLRAAQSAALVSIASPSAIRQADGWRGALCLRWQYARPSKTMDKQRAATPAGHGRPSWGLSVRGTCPLPASERHLRGPPSSWDAGVWSGAASRGCSPLSSSSHTSGTSSLPVVDRGLCGRGPGQAGNPRKQAQMGSPGGDVQLRLETM